jgi:hypothetical protein
MRSIIWQSLITVGASVLGWGLAMIGQAVQAGRENRREHYYKVLERTEDIFARCSALSNSVYEFHQECVKLAASSDRDDTIITDFITRFQSQLASIHMSQRILYPGIKIDTGPISRTADDLAEGVRKMWDLASEERTTVERMQFSQRAALNQTERETAIRTFGNELGLIMNIMATSLNKKAVRLRIKAEPVTVDRSNLPTA